jgi:hypothetical protein
MRNDSTRGKRRVLLDQLYKWDSSHDTSYVRELEMTVDAIVTFEPAYCAQFFIDCRLYGIDEAKMYLVNFVEKRYHSPNQLAKDVARLSKLIGDIHEALETGVPSGVR